MWFFDKLKKKVQEKKIDLFYNAFADLKKNKDDEPLDFKEPMTFAKARLEQGANDFGYRKALTKYNDHKVKVQNQWINPLQSVNSGFGNAQNSFYNYQSVNYYECYALAQDPLFNKIFNILSKTPFANGGNVVADFSDEQKEVFENSVKKWDVYGTFVRALRSTYVCGGCLVLMDFGQTNYEEPLNLKKMNMKNFKGFIQIDPINLVAIEVNTVNPARSDYMKPKTWYVVGLGSVHASHFLKFEDNLPELIMRPMTLYFGMPLTLLIKQDIANSNLASQGLANMMNRFRYLYMKTGQENFTSDSAINFRNRLEAMSMVQDNFGVYPIKDSEDMFQLTTSLTGMNDNAEFFYQVIASKTDITLSILLGKGAQGLSGTLEGERKNFYDRMRSEQEMVKSNLLIALGIVYGWATDGKFVEFTDYLFNPLEQSDEKEKAENMRSYTEVAGKLIEMGVKNEDVLTWLKQFRDFNLENVEFDADTEGLEEYQDMGEYEAKEEGQRQFNSAFEDKVAFVMREFEEGKLKDSHGNIVTDKDQALAIAYSEAREKVNNSEWDEQKHPRDKSGQFTSKGRGYQSGGESGSIKTNKSFENVIERVKDSNKKNITAESVVETFIKENPSISKKDIQDAVKKAEDYKEEKSFVNDKGQKQYIDTQSVFTYKDKKGNSLYTNERIALHNEIMKKLFSNYQNAKPEKNKTPTFTILGGRGGSGKSKLKGLAYDPENAIVLDADAIKEMMPEYKGFNAWEVHEESSDILKEALRKAKDMGLNVVLDGTMSGFASTEKKIKMFEDAGYNIDGYYMHLPREESAKRGISRFMTGGTAKGRYVPTEVMLDMKSNEETFQKLLPHFRKWAMWDNNVKRGQEPILIQKSWK